MTRKSKLNFQDSQEVVLQYYDATTTNGVQAVLPLLGITASKKPGRSFPHSLVALEHFLHLSLNTTRCVANVGSCCWVSVGIDKPSFLNISLLDNRNTFSNLVRHSDGEWRQVELFMWQIHQNEIHSSKYHGKRKKTWTLHCGTSSAMYLLCNIGKVFLHFPLVTSSVNNYIV